MPKWLQIEVEREPAEGERSKSKKGRSKSKRADQPASAREEPSDRDATEWSGDGGDQSPSPSSGNGAARFALGLVAVALVAGLGLLAGRLLRPGSASGGQLAIDGGALAWVNGEPISTRDVDIEYGVQSVLRQRIQGETLVDKQAIDGFRRELVDRLVDRWLALQDARANGLVVTDAEIDAELPTLGARFGISSEELKAAVFAVQPNLNDADWRTWGAQQILLGRYLNSPRAAELANESMRTIGRSADQVSAVAGLLSLNADLQFLVNGESVAPAREGQLAPDFVLPAPDGTPMRLSDFRGRPVMVNFWATWCAPCRIEMPLFVNAYESNKEDLVILGVNSQERPDQVVPYVQGAGLTFPIVIDDGTVSAIYRVKALPTTFFIDAQGMIVRAHRGAIRSRPELKPFIEEILPGVQLGSGSGVRDMLLAFVHPSRGATSLGSTTIR